jgi:TolA-binding protein
VLWLGVEGRKKISALEMQLAALQDQFEKLHQDFRTLDLEVTGHVDKLTGIAKRFTGRKGGRPPAAPEANGDAEGDSESRPPSGFSRHVL